MTNTPVENMPLDCHLNQTPSPGKTPSGLGEAILAVKAVGAAAAQNVDITTLGENARMGKFDADDDPGCKPSGRGGFWSQEFAVGEFSRALQGKVGL
jgi:hypothetical protein